MKDNFDKCLKALLVTEGGYSDNRRDRGGPTNKGVTQTVYDEWRRDNRLPCQTVRSICQDELASLYNKLYWAPVYGDQMPYGLDYCLFDFAVNSGPHRAIKYLQRMLQVPDDGQIGPKTIAALKNFPVYDLIDGICDLRLNFLQHLDNFDAFGKGWTTRIIDVREDAKDMADE